tara:strand:+ start:50 stop:661 length:612 start_codon:yes stop_codon:yes gene_type:complete
MGLVKHNNNSLTNLTALPSVVPTGKMTLLSTATASSSASLSFNSTYINGDYQMYKFEFINIHPATDNTDFMFNVSIDNGSNYNIAKTTTTFQAYHNEAGNDQALNYETSDDLAQGTGFQQLLKNLGTDNDQNSSGFMSLFNPSSTVFVKHFIANGNSYNHNDYTNQNFTAGYANTTSAVNAIQFKMSSGNIDAGQIKLYGLGN